MNRRGVYYAPAANSPTDSLPARNFSKPDISPTYASSIFGPTNPEPAKPSSHSGVVRCMQPTTNYAALSVKQSQISSPADYSLADRARRDEDYNGRMQVRSNGVSSKSPSVQIRGRDDYEYLVRSQAKKELVDSWQQQIQSKKEAEQQLLREKEQEKNIRLQELQDMINKQKYRTSPLRSQENFQKTVEEIEFDKNMNMFFGESTLPPQTDQLNFEVNKAAFYGYKPEPLSPVKAPMDVPVPMEISSPPRLAKNTVKTVMHNPITGSTVQFQPPNSMTIPSLGKKSVENIVSNKINFSPPPPLELSPSYTAKNPKVHNYNPLTGNSRSPFYRPVVARSEPPSSQPSMSEARETEVPRTRFLNKAGSDNEAVIYKIGQGPAPELSGNIRIVKGRGYKATSIF